MKATLFTFLSGIALTSFGQEIEIGSTIRFSVPAIHSGTDKNNKVIYNTSNKTVNYLNTGINFTVMEIDRGSKLYQLVPIPFNPLKKPNGSKIDLSEYYNYKIFNVVESEIITKAFLAPEIPDRFTIGLLTLPFKFRLQAEKSFETKFNLNSTLNCYLWSPFGTSLSLQLGAGIGGTELNASNAEGIRNNGEIDAAILTWLIGPMLQYKKAQAGIYIGKDYINNQSYYKWNHQAKTWIAFGVGYQLFDIGLGGEKQKNKNN